MKKYIIIPVFLSTMAMLTCAGWRGAFDDAYFSQITVTPAPKVKTYTWHSGPAVPLAVCFPAVGVLNDKIIVASGRGAPTNVWSFDETNWVSLPSLLVARSWFTGGTTYSNNFYVVGGGVGDWSASTNVEYFDGSTWTIGPALPNGVSGNAGISCRVFQGLLYAVWGTNVVAFNGTTWVSKPGVPKVDGRANFTAVFQERLYSVGGAVNWTPYTNVYYFDGTNWTETLGLPTATKTAWGNIETNNLGELYAGFRWDGFTNSWIYRGSGSSWSNIVYSPVGQWAYGVNYRGKIYLIGGNQAGGVFTNVQYLESTEE